MIYKTFNSMQSQPLSSIGFGCWALGDTWSNHDQKLSTDSINRAIEHGINFFDTAPIYGKGASEELLGKALKGYRRDKIIMATKCGLIWNEKGRVRQNISAESLRLQLEQSLKRLQTNYIDLYQIHWPYLNMPLEEALHELALMQQKGLIRWIGLSNFSPVDLLKAQSITSIASYQGLYNLLEPNASHYHRTALPYRSHDEIFPLCQQYNMPFIPYSPLMQGMLTGKFTDGQNFSRQDERMSNDNLRGEGLRHYLAIMAQLKEYCGEIGKSVHQVAINYLTRQKVLGPVICGMHKPSHLDENLAALDWQLTNLQCCELEAIAHQKS